MQIPVDNRQRSCRDGLQAGSSTSMQKRAGPRGPTRESDTARLLSFNHRDGGIRTRDPLNPIQVRYRAALRPVRGIPPPSEAEL
jgi:hypothetical protein